MIMPDLDSTGRGTSNPVSKADTGLLPLLDAVRLEMPWTRPRVDFWSNLLVLLRGPMPPKEFLGGPYFRDCWITASWPKGAITLALALQVAFILLHPHWDIVSPRPATVEAELTWYGDPADLPLVSPEQGKERADRAPETNQPQPAVGADAYHPRQTIVSAPLHPTHPRQVLVQPDAPDVAPKILPALPNILKWADDSPARPRLSLSQQQLAQLHPEARRTDTTNPVAAPHLADPQLQVGPVDIAQNSAVNDSPSLALRAMSTGRTAARHEEANSPAPDVTGDIGGDSGHVIAISATPAPPAPPPAVPEGNLSARVSISPDGPRPGAPGGAANGGGESASGGGSGSGATGISISGGAADSGISVSGLSNGPSHDRHAYAVVHESVRSLPAPPPEENVTPSNFASLGPDARPEVLLGSGRVYTLHIDMPNLTSASGSWILSFAAMDDGASRQPGEAPRGELARPEPLRKVDPRYPPHLRSERVEGEVVLYAIIRKDGTVDSIQLVRGVDPELDNNAMEALAAWKFRPAEQEGAPVDVVAIVRIPFHAIAPDR